MRITVKRIAKKNTYTIGKLYVDGQYLCDTLEDKDRGLTDSMSESEIKKKKVMHQTAIPTGIYKVSQLTSHEAEMRLCLLSPAQVTEP